MRTLYAFVTLFNICTKYNRIILCLNLEMHFVLCSQTSWMSISEFIFHFYCFSFTDSVPVNLLSSVHIRLNSKRYSHTFFSLRLSLVDFLKTLQKFRYFNFMASSNYMYPPPFCILSGLVAVSFYFVILNLLEPSYHFSCIHPYRKFNL